MSMGNNKEHIVKSNKPRLLVSIVNYKSSELACNALDGLLKQLDASTDRVCIVDNNSGDHSVDVLNAYVEQHDVADIVEVVASERNGGFSYGNNLAIRSAIENENSRPEYVLLLNPDTLVCDGAIDALLSFMREKPHVGIAGSRLEEEDGTVQHSSFRFHTLLSELNAGLRFGLVTRLLRRWKLVPDSVSDTACLTDWVAGAGMIINTDVFDDIGLMDEHYFLYFEETDFCLQAKRNGWECWYVPDSRIIHFVGQSTGVVSGSKTNRRRPKYWFEARQYYFKKNHGLIYTMLADLIWGSSFFLYRLRRKIQNKEDHDPVYMARDFWRNSSFFNCIRWSKK